MKRSKNKQVDLEAGFAALASQTFDGIRIANLTTALKFLTRFPLRQSGY